MMTVHSNPSLQVPFIFSFSPLAASRLLVTLIQVTAASMAAAVANSIVQKTGRTKQMAVKEVNQKKPVNIMMKATGGLRGWMVCVMYLGKGRQLCWR